MPKDTRELYQTHAKIVSSRLYTEASGKVVEETEKEKKVEDPSPEEARAAIEEARINENQTGS